MVVLIGHSKFPTFGFVVSCGAFRLLQATGFAAHGEDFAVKKDGLQKDFEG